jgi:hypothetical protein
MDQIKQMWIRNIEAAGKLFEVFVEKVLALF